MDRYQAREIVLKSAHISHGSRLLYLALDNYQRDGANCWPRQKTLCGIINCSERMLRYYLEVLISEGFCRKERTERGGPNRYILFHRYHRQPIAAPPATGYPTHRQPIAAHKANREMKPNNPLTPASGGIASCPICLDSQNRIEVSKDGRRPVRMWCPECGGKRKTA